MQGSAMILIIARLQRGLDRRCGMLINIERAVEAGRKSEALSSTASGCQKLSQLLR